MIRYLVDSSALWRLLREETVRAAWSDVITAGAVGSCRPLRVEFRRSARNLDEFEQMTAMFELLYPEVAVPKQAWQWIDTAQYRLLTSGAHRVLGLVDLLICAVAAHNDLVVLHDDRDFATAAERLVDVGQRAVRDFPV